MDGQQLSIGEDDVTLSNGAVQNALAVLALAVSVIALLQSCSANHTSNLSLSESTRRNQQDANATLTGLMRGIQSSMLEKPGLRKFLYDKAAVPASGTEEFDRVMTLCEMFADFAAIVAMYYVESPDAMDETWANSVSDTYKNSPALQAYFENSKHLYNSSVEHLFRGTLNWRRRP